MPPTLMDYLTEVTGKKGVCFDVCSVCHSNSNIIFAVADSM